VATSYSDNIARAIRVIISELEDMPVAYDAYWHIRTATLFLRNAVHLLDYEPDKNVKSFDIGEITEYSRTNSAGCAEAQVQTKGVEPPKGECE